MYSSDEVFVRVEVVPSFLDIPVRSLDINFVPKETANTSEALDELEAFLALVSDEV